MPRIAEIKIIDKDVWCKVELERSTDVCGTISLYTPSEIKDIERSAIKNFLIDIFQYHVGDW